MAKLVYNEKDSHLIECMLKVALKSLQNTLGKDFSTGDIERTKEILEDMKKAKIKPKKESGSTSSSLDCEECEV
tara:strand:- start:444 stop:665 length:222 start_codon:yes stop_codon:yes gene_type:complete